MNAWKEQENVNISTIRIITHRVKVCFREVAIGQRKKMVNRRLGRRPLSKNPGGSLRPRFEPIFSASYFGNSDLPLLVAVIMMRVNFHRNDNLRSPRRAHFFCLRYLFGLCVAFFDSLSLSADFLPEEAHLCGSWNCRRPENQACASNSSHLLPVGQFYICPGVTLQDVTESPATRIFLFKLNHPFQFGFFNYDDVFADSQMWLLMSIL